MKRASSDVGFMLVAYNLKRIGNILTKDLLGSISGYLFSCFLVKKSFSKAKLSCLGQWFS